MSGTEYTICLQAILLLCGHGVEVATESMITPVNNLISNRVSGLFEKTNGSTNIMAHVYKEC